jgi:hypothetical protein
MERSLVWSAFALGCVGWLCGLLLTRGARAGASARLLVEKALLWTAVALPVVVFLATLPSKPPFAVGHGLGNGFLVGGAAALLSAFILLRLRREDNPISAAMAASAPFWAAVAAVCVPLLGSSENLIDSLMGVAVGTCVVNMVLWYGLKREEVSSLTTSALIAGAGFTATLAAAVALGNFHGTTAFESLRLSSAAVTVGAVVPLALLIASLPLPLLLRLFARLRVAGTLSGSVGKVLHTDESKRLAEQVFQGALAIGLTLLLGWLLGKRLVTEAHFFPVVGLGLAASLLVWWLLAEGVKNGQEGAAYREPLSLLLVLGVGMVAFAWLGGFGMGIVLLMGWLFGGIALAKEAQAVSPEPSVRREGAYAPLLSTLLFGTVLVLFRFVMSRYSTEFHGETITEHYAIFGFLLGVALPPVLAGLAPRDSQRNNGALSIARLIVAALVTLAVPGLAIVLWKSKCILAMLAGLSLSAAGLRFYDSLQRPDSLSKPEADIQRFTPALFALATALAISQWTGHALLLGTLTRNQKMHLLEWVVGGIVVLIVVVDIGDRVAAARRAKAVLNEAPLAAETGGRK